MEIKFKENFSLGVASAATQIEKSFSKTLAVMSNMAIAHLKAYEIIHNMRKDMGFHDTKVSFANHVRVFEPKNPKSIKQRIYAKLMDYLFQGAITIAMTTGKFKWPLKGGVNKGTDSIPQGEYIDFIAINYYTRTTVTNFDDGTREGSYKNDLGWEIYPEGLIRCANNIYHLLERPIYITENGTCDNEDMFRSKYIYEHLKAITQSDLPISRYYHWCFCDNFEWVEGESARFGLVNVNYETQERTVKSSGKFYSLMIEEQGVTEKLYNQFVKPQKYHY
jgi:beta-glucosidase